VPEVIPGSIDEEPQWKMARISLMAGRVSEYYHLLEYSFQLPKDLPDYLSTTIFTNDRFLVKALVIQKNEIVELQPAQGKLIRPFTFDVRNMYTDRLTVLLPRDFLMDDHTVYLVYWSGSKKGVANVWKNQPDNFGFDYVAAQNGWLVIHYPYDKRWKMMVDDHPVKIYRVNKSFIGVPIQEGPHHILLQYWPGSILRSLILLSMVLSMMALIGVIGVGIRKSAATNI
jgi:uncharacterized membrane protein YfhO